MGAMANLRLYHGSTEEDLIPTFGKGKPTNDYGTGFYCTEDLGLACEWACMTEAPGWVYEYTLNTDGLKMLDLCRIEFTALNWIAMLLNYRVFNTEGAEEKKNREYLISNFLPDLNGFDLIKGYRADDSYFRYAKRFFSNAMSLESLELSLKLGDLGVQTVLKSKRSFDKLTPVSCVKADYGTFRSKFVERDEKARTEFNEIDLSEPEKDEIFMRDIRREGWKDGDPRIPRDIS